MDLAFELAGYVFVVLLGIIPIVNPFSTAPVLVSMTAHVDAAERRRTATMACLYMGLLLLVFLFVGALILQFFGITLKSLRLAGGLVIAYMGFRMLFPPANGASGAAEESRGDVRQLAFTPLAMPMLCGPGSISVVLAMATEVSQQEVLFAKVAGYVVVALGIILSAVFCWLVFISASAVTRFLGKSGIEAVTKLMGFLLICIGMEFILTSLSIA